MIIDILKEPDWLSEAAALLNSQNKDSLDNILSNPEKFSMDSVEASSMLKSIIEYSKATRERLNVIMLKYNDIARYFEAISPDKSNVVINFMRFCKADEMLMLSGDKLERNLLDFMLCCMLDEFTNELGASDENESAWRGKSFEEVLSYFAASKLSSDYKLKLLDLYSNRNAVFPRFNQLFTEVIQIVQDCFYIIKPEYEKANSKLLVPETVKRLITKNMGMSQFIENEALTVNVNTQIIAFNSMCANITEALNFHLKIGLYFEILADGKANARFNVDAMAELFKIFADKSRLKILKLLMKRKHYLQEISNAMELTPATISHHMDRLIESDCVCLEIDPNDRKIYYTLNTKGFLIIQEFIDLFKIAGGQ
ncbi:MAG: winged helix-turn-helix domain-containing protein [Clostridia bacterium]